jgi:phytol kinase
MNPSLGIAVVMLALGGLMLGLRHATLHPEVSRKAVHVALGLIALSFPWLFDQDWPVIVLAAAAVLFLGGIRIFKPARTQFGGVLGGVQRPSLGELYFPVAVAIVFCAARGNRLLFCVPVLVLALADAVGALIGLRFGHSRYTTDDGYKSLEGSAAFFIVAFLSTWLPLLLSPGTGRAEAILISVQIGLFVMLMEAFAWRGLDNLFVPLTTFVQLKIYLGMSAGSLLLRVAVLLVIAGFAILWHRRTFLNTSAMLGAAMVLYASWALGGWAWLMAPLIVLLCYSALCPREMDDARDPHPAKGVLAVAAAGLCWLFLAYGLNMRGLLYPFTVALATELALIRVAFFKWRRPQYPTAGVFVHAILMGYGLVYLPYALMGQRSPRAALEAGIALAAVAGAVGAFFIWQIRPHGCPVDDGRWLRQGAIGAIVSLAASIPIIWMQS